jgi:Coatomer (COPI) alpha subunit C-terminus
VQICGTAPALKPVDVIASCRWAHTCAVHVSPVLWGGNQCISYLHCREYNIAMRTELARKQAGADNVNRGAELAAYFTHAKLQPMHQVSALQLTGGRLPHSL